ncbi:MAG: LexA family transcriptional regulator [Filomicrobium sp.]
MDLAELIKKSRENAGFSQEYLAEKMGVTRQTVSDWENRRGAPRRRRLAELEEILRLQPGALDVFSYPGVAIEQRGTGYFSADVRTIPIFQLSDFSEGEPMRDEEHGRAAVGEEIPKDSYGIVIADKSMEPEYVAGDIVIAAPSITPRDGDDVLAIYDGCPVLRRYRPRGGAFDLVPLSDDHATVTINAAQPGMVLAVVLEHRRKRRPAVT